MKIKFNAMRKFILILIFATLSCKGQEVKKIDLSGESEMNYIFARISNSKPNSKWLYNYGLHVNIFKLSDSKATPKGQFKEYHGSLVSYLVSIAPDGDYYVWSKLYKIEGLLNPKIIEIKELTYPKFLIKIEHGSYNNRLTDLIEIIGK